MSCRGLLDEDRERGRDINVAGHLYDLYHRKCIGKS